MRGAIDKPMAADGKQSRQDRQGSYLVRNIKHPDQSGRYCKKEINACQNINNNTP
jgi:hypothetical protein